MYLLTLIIIVPVHSLRTLDEVLKAARSLNPAEHEGMRVYVFVSVCLCILACVF